MSELPDPTCPEAGVFENTESRVSRVGAACGKLAGRLGLLGVRAGLVAGCGMAALGAFGETEKDIGPATVSAEMTIDLDGNAIAETNIGSVYFDASDGPFGMRGRIKTIDADAPQVVREHLDSHTVRAASSGAGQVLESYQDSLGELVGDARRRGMLLLLGGGIFGGITAELGIGMARSQRQREIPDKRRLGIMGTTALLIPNLMLTGASALTAATLNEDALEHPRFGNDSLGELAAFAQNSFDILDIYATHSDRLTEWLDNLIAIQNNAEALPTADNGLIPVLAISDTHSRPCSYDRAQLLINAFNVSFVINAGDESEWGQPFEQEVFACDDTGTVPHIQTMGELTLPDGSGPIKVVMAPGNHDPNGIIGKLDAYPSVIIPKSETVELAVPHTEGPVTFKITGATDPLNTPLFWERPSPEVERSLVEERGREVGRIALIDNPDIVLIHQPRAGEVIDEMLGPDNEALIVQGHTHRFEVDPERGMITLGSFGGEGLRSLQNDPSDENSTMQASIMYFDPATKQLVWGWDIRIQNDGRSTIEPFYFQELSRENSSELVAEQGE